MSNQKYISVPVMKRLPRYYRFLGILKDKGIEKISSLELSRQMGLTASQIRQDFNCFGGFGQQGYGYNISVLHKEIGEILGIENKRKIILIGAGNLGQAVARHMSFSKWGFELCGIFDSDKACSGNMIKNIIVADTESLPEFCKSVKPLAAVLCVPNTEDTEKLIDDLVKLGIKAFWNFTHIDIKGKYPGVIVENVHLSDSLVTLCYQLNSVL